ncbi:hypothetical protein GCM10020221_07950 [Streptomyces thioluteus]|uniref:EngC GTPase domain-containing protein n=1 Tax=Streptomyces thioluteus TaxID=66431 RepID=A0ABN3WGH5_STRTU
MSTAAHPLTAYGWDEGFADSHAPFAVRGLVPGRIVRVDRGHCDVVVASADGTGVRTVRADAAPVATGDPIGIMCTGDWAAVDLTAGHVRALLPRPDVPSCAPPPPSGPTARSWPPTWTGRSSRSPSPPTPTSAASNGFLALAWESGAEPVVALTKADLVPDAGTLAHLLADTRAVAPRGARVLAVSSATGEGVGELAALLAGGTGVLLGQSGAGKSTLANALVGEDVQDVRGHPGPRREGTAHDHHAQPAAAAPAGRGRAHRHAGAAGGGALGRVVRCRPGVLRTSSRWRRRAASTTAVTTGSRGARSRRRSRPASSATAGSTATASCCGRTRGIAARTDARAAGGDAAGVEAAAGEGERAADLKRGRSRR